ncbi:1-acyl-sn-glycerol-3-phosphate acyltransferase [Ziziphus jujuba]|uniref:1-acyl-sn-glycerol-3-phosphate acyltransferase n=1 Tax=Ziziphus jujuba TaxID=326968 RepID=A0ABM3I9M5_ZIZJJ|nr:1-acyl-sn-glycerol-3-phosphate acyltransferase [Ziziphus jujuba]
MDNSGSGSIMRNRRLESFLNTSSAPTYREKPQVSVKEAAQKPKADVYQDDDDDDGWVLALISCIRIVTCFLTMMVTTFIYPLIMLVLLPWPYERIRQGNIYGHVTGRLLVSYPFFPLFHVNLPSVN